MCGNIQSCFAPLNDRGDRTNQLRWLKLLQTWYISLLRYHGRWIDSVWKSPSHADALKENPINLYTFSGSLIVIEYNHIFEIF